MRTSTPEDITTDDLVTLEKPKEATLTNVILCYDDNNMELRAVEKGQITSIVPWNDRFLYELAEDFSLIYNEEEKQRGKKQRTIGIGGAIPQELLYASSVTEEKHAVIWREPAGSRDLKFNIKGLSGSYYFPTMIMGMLSGSISLLLEIKGKYYVPDFPNFYGEGDMCHGTVQISFKDKMTWNEMIEYGRKAFFDTYFSHVIEDTMFAEMFNQNEFKCKLPKALNKKEREKNPLLTWL